MEIVAAVAIGLNPYVGTFMLAALFAFTTHAPQTDLIGVVPGAAFAALALFFGFAVPADFVFGKIHRFAPAARKLSQLTAPASGAFFAAAVARPEWPLPVVAVLGAVIAWTVSAMLTVQAARASRSPAWVGYGHVPVLMAAATSAASMVPLGLARPEIGIGCAAAAVTALLWATVAGWRTVRTAAPVRRTATRAAHR